MIIGAKISMQLASLGYEVTGLLPRGEDALLHIEKNIPNIVLLDINLKGALDGIQTAEALMEKYSIPLIYLTANSDEATFNRAKHTRPAAFISKPFKQLDLQRAIELVIASMALKSGDAITEKEGHGAELHLPYILTDRIFIRSKEKMIKIMISDILYIEADRNYSRIFTSTREHVLSITLKLIDERLPQNYFIRIHRSYIINLQHVEEVADSYVRIANSTIPISNVSKDQLLTRLQTL